MTNLTTLDYWTNAQGEINLALGSNNIISEWINAKLKDNNIKTCLEIGCYPGKFLTILGKRGVEVNGIDFIPAVLDLDQVFIKEGYKVGKFINEDFTKFKFEKRYDCVMSFGFIEHFTNWEDIFKQQLDLVSENGYAIIEVPNFKGFFQRIPRFLFDYKNYKRHNIESMDLHKWNRILEDRGFEIISSDYFGAYQLWFEESISNRILLNVKKYILKLLKRYKKLIHGDKKEHHSFSCVLGVIARKRGV